MKYEITSKKEFQIEAAKALLADGQPHSYAEIVQHIRSQAEGTVLEGRIDYGNVWYSLRSMMEEPGSHYQKAGWGAYQKDPPQRRMPRTARVKSIKSWIKPSSCWNDSNLTAAEYRVS